MARQAVQFIVGIWWLADMELPVIRSIAWGLPIRDVLAEFRPLLVGIQA